MKNMLFILGFALLAMVSGCKKNIVEQAQASFALNVMTNGQWKITKFTRAGNDITTDFAAYKFQYYDNSTVDAIKNGTVERTGSWQADPANQQMSITYTNVNYPLSILNGTWKITNNSLTFVEGTQTVNGEVLSLRIEK